MKMNIDNKIQRNISQNKIVNNSIESKNIRISEPNKDVFIKFSNNQKNDNNDKKHNTFKKITIAALAIGAISTLAAFIVHKKVKKNKNISDEIFITPEQRKNFEELAQQIPALNKITDDIDKVFYLKHIIPKVENLTKNNFIEYSPEIYEYINKKNSYILDLITERLQTKEDFKHLFESINDKNIDYFKEKAIPEAIKFHKVNQLENSWGDIAINLNSTNIDYLNKLGEYAKEYKLKSNTDIANLLKLINNKNGKFLVEEAYPNVLKYKEQLNITANDYEAIFKSFQQSYIQSLDILIKDIKTTKVIDENGKFNAAEFNNYLQNTRNQKFFEFRQECDKIHEQFMKELNENNREFEKNSQKTLVELSIQRAHNDIKKIGEELDKSKQEVIDISPDGSLSITQNMNQYITKKTQALNKMLEIIRPKSSEMMYGNDTAIFQLKNALSIYQREPKGLIIFYGPKGCGKSQIINIRNVINEFNLKKYNWDNKGNEYSNLLKLAKDANSEYQNTFKRTAIVIDDIDSLFANSNDIDKIKELIAEMPNKYNCIIFGTTRNPEKINPILMNNTICETIPVLPIIQRKDLAEILSFWIKPFEAENIDYDHVANTILKSLDNECFSTSKITKILEKILMDSATSSKKINFVTQFDLIQYFKEQKPDITNEELNIFIKQIEKYNKKGV